MNQRKAPRRFLESPCPDCEGTSYYEYDPMTQKYSGPLHDPPLPTKSERNRKKRKRREEGGNDNE